MPFKIKERFCGNFNTSSVLWLHGASLGECQVLLFLAKRLAREIKNCPPILLTSQKAEVVDFLKIKQFLPQKLFLKKAREELVKVLSFF